MQQKNRINTITGGHHKKWIRTDNIFCILELTYFKMERDDVWRIYLIVIFKKKDDLFVTNEVKFTIWAIIIKISILIFTLM